MQRWRRRQRAVMLLCAVVEVPPLLLHLLLLPPPPLHLHLHLLLQVPTHGAQRAATMPTLQLALQQPVRHLAAHPVGALQ